MRTTASSSSKSSSSLKEPTGLRLPIADRPTMVGSRLLQLSLGLLLWASVTHSRPVGDEAAALFADDEGFSFELLLRLE